MRLFDWLFGKRGSTTGKPATGSSPKATGAPTQPPQGQNVAIVTDRGGGPCGLWVRQASMALDRELLGMLSISLKLPDQCGMAIFGGNYRVVPNTHDAAGGSFVMFGDALAPGEERKSSDDSGRCHKCGKPTSELSPGAFSGDALRSMLRATSYPCKACGTEFCRECMIAIKADPCPNCGKALGW